MCNDPIIDFRKTIIADYFVRYPEVKEIVMTTAVLPRDYLSIDTMLSDEERDIRDTVRAFVASHVLPNVGDWFDEGRLPRELVGELGKLGVLGMHLEGYGCAGTSATAYGLACLELEAGDSGIRSLVSVQGSLAMFAIHRWGSEEQKQEWLPRMAAGEAVGCFGLTEPDSGSDPGSMRTYARRDGADWVLRGQKMWITNGSWADVAVVWARTEEGIRGFLVPRDTRGFTTPDIHKKLSLRASITSELILDEVRLPASAMLPGATSLRGPLSCLNEARYGIVWGAAGAARACLEAAMEYSTTRVQFGKPIASFSDPTAQARDDGSGGQPGDDTGATSRPPEGRGPVAARTCQHGQAGQCQRGARGCADGPAGTRRERNHAGVPGDSAHGQPGVRRHLRGDSGCARAGHRRHADRD
jgi:glutaryl-CoA dehydrogenase